MGRIFAYAAKTGLDASEADGLFQRSADYTEPERGGMTVENPASRRWQNALPYLVIFCAALALYAKTLAFEFIPSWDDSEYVINNLYIRAFTADNLTAIFTGSFFLNYTPVQLLSYMADYQAWGLDPAGYHLTNVILHAANACLAYALIGRVAANRKIAFVSAMLFAVHPVNVENTAWISERKTLLSALFSMLAVMSYIGCVRGRGKGAYPAAIVFFILAVISKPVAVVLPAVLAAYEMTLGNGLKKSALALVPLFAISAALAVVTFTAQSGGGSVGAETLSAEMLFGTVYPSMLPVFWKYAALVLWPFNQSGFYDTTLYDSFLSPMVIVSAVALAAAWVIVLRYCGGQGRFWFLWFWLWVLPVSNIIPLPVFYADRYMYMPAISFFVLIGWAAQRVSLPGASRQGRIHAAVVTVLIVFYASIAFFRVDVWENELVFWTDAAAKSPNMYVPHLNRGFSLEERGMYAEAVKEYEAAVRIYPASEAIDNLNMARLKRDLKTGQTGTLPQETLAPGARQ